MPSRTRILDTRPVVHGVPEYLIDPDKLARYLGVFHPAAPGPAIAEFQPWKGYAGTTMVIVGSGFAAERAENLVEVGGQSAFVVEGDANRLLVLTDPLAQTGPVRVSVAGNSGDGPRDFEVLPWPTPGSGEDGPPYPFEGHGFAAGAPAAGTVPPTGTAQVLVVPCYPTDLVPADLAAARQTIVDTFANVTTFYDQVSYGTLDVQVDVPAFVPLLNDAAHYHKANGAAGYPNIDQAALDQLMAEAAQGAVDAGFDLDDYTVLAALVYLPGLSVRAWGGWSAQNFAYNDGAGTAINLTASHQIGLIAARHDADWGRAAHEFAHNMVDSFGKDLLGQVLPEDVYASDLVDPSAASAENFELMGNHDSHPMFSGYFMYQLGYYAAANVVDLQWDRNPFANEYELVAHGLAEDATASRYHLIRIRAGDGLYYFVEVRQRPDPTAVTPQIFDENIPLPMGTTRTGGVVVTKAVTATLNNNQQTRLVTLLHAPRVLLEGDVAVDPLRGLQISVVDDQVQAQPLVCRVRVEWAQQIGDTPGGDFDLRIEPWGPGYETIDIWVDRMPYGSYDFVDPSGNPTGNGDEPRPLEINRFWARVRNDGAIDANNVQLTFYAISPPGVGDNGTWSPINTKPFGLVAQNGSAQDYVNWVPLVGQHTCLKVAAGLQLGEVSVGNNTAQENIFTFQPAASSVPDPVALSLAVRNPLDVKALVHVLVDGVPQGFRVYFPHRWVWLEPLGERQLDLLVVPTVDIDQMERRQADVRVTGTVAHAYTEKLDMTGIPGTWMAPIGGVLSRVLPKRRGEIELEEDPETTNEERLGVQGRVKPQIGGQKLRVDLTHPDGEVEATIAETDQVGRFRVVFGVRSGEREQKLIYEVQAHIFNATQIAPADSNIVRFYR